MGWRPACHPSLRLKLSAAFAGAMTVLLIGLGVFIYNNFRAALDSSLDQSLRSRASDVHALNMQADTGLAESRILTNTSNLGFAQVLRDDGRVLDATPGAATLRLLSVAERRTGARGPLLIDRSSLPGGPVRLYVTPARSQDQSPVLVVVGASLRDRQAALHELSAVMLLGGPIALLLASLLGYAVSALSLRSVERLRRRASALSVTQPGERLAVPAANDELRSLAVTLNQMLERNEAAFERERRFAADASHELRTPLSVLKAELELALTTKSSVGELRAAVASADAEADRVIRLAQDLLVLSQADHGTLPLKLTHVSVADALAQVERRFAARAGAQQRRLMTGDTHGLHVEADTVQLVQALWNLVENALRYATGDVTLRVERRSDTVELHVEDEGPGFPEGFLAVAFERFTRADGSRTSEGTGLGLAIVRSIVRAHGGEVRAVNRSGGADVWLELPSVIRARRSVHKPAPSGDPRAPADQPEVVV